MPFDEHVYNSNAAAPVGLPVVTGNSRHIYNVRRISDGKWLFDVRADGRPVLNFWRDKAADFGSARASHIVGNLNVSHRDDPFELVLAGVGGST